MNFNHLPATAIYLLAQKGCKKHIKLPTNMQIYISIGIKNISAEETAIEHKANSTLKTFLETGLTGAS